jgi:hypothetical protein
MRRTQGGAKILLDAATYHGSDRLMREDPAFAQAVAARASQKSDDDDTMLALLSSVSRATQDQKLLVGILCRGFMGMSIAGVIGEKHGTMEKVILDFREPLGVADADVLGNSICSCKFVRGFASGVHCSRRSKPQPI